MVNITYNFKFLKTLAMFYFSIILIFSANSQTFEASKCSISCVTEFGTVIGEANGVKSYSNCQSLCLKNQENHLKNALFKDVYTGIQYQCVEYARRWLIENKKLTFGSIDYAYQIWDLNFAYNPINEKEKVQFTNYKNSNRHPPQVGDLIIYDKSKSLPGGHVAIITKVNFNEKYIGVAEQNYENKMWENQKEYSRRLSVNKINGFYELKDLKQEKQNKLQNNETSEKIIGWKRLSH